MSATAPDPEGALARLQAATYDALVELRALRELQQATADALREAEERLRPTWKYIERLRRACRWALEDMEAGRASPGTKCLLRDVLH